MFQLEKPESAVVNALRPISSLRDLHSLARILECSHPYTKVRVTSVVLGTFLTYPVLHFHSVTKDCPVIVITLHQLDPANIAGVEKTIPELIKVLNMELSSGKILPKSDDTKAIEV